MSPTEEQRAALERLQENESLTDNLDDTTARALLAWAEDQILRDVAPARVFSALRAANRSAPETTEQALAAAQAALADSRMPASTASPATSDQHAQPAPPAEQPSPRRTGTLAHEPRAATRWTRLRDWLLGRSRDQH